MKKRGNIAAFLLILAIVLYTQSGCIFDRYLKINPGEFVPTNFQNTANRISIEKIKVDRNSSQIEIIHTNGASLMYPFTARPKQQWPSGCPGNIGSHLIEVFDLNTQEISTGNTILHNPVLVRNCPENPEIIILREDGQIGGPGTACSDNIKCMHFQPISNSG